MTLPWNTGVVASGYLLVLAQLVLCATRYAHISDSYEGLFVMLAPIPWLLLALSRYRPLVVIPWSAIGLLVLQVWGVVAYAYAGSITSAELKIDDQTFLFLSYFTTFASAYVLVCLHPPAREWILNGVIALAVTGCVVGVAQYLRLPLALSIQEYYFPISKEVSGGSAAEVRASGLNMAQSTFAMTSCTAFAFCLSRLFRSGWRWHYVVILPLLLFGIMAPQVRSILPAVGIMLIWASIHAVRRFKTKGVAVLGLVVLLAFAAVQRGHLLQYVLQKDLHRSGPAKTSIQFREQTTWPQATAIYKRFPLTGIGPDWRFAYQRDATVKGIGDKWVPWGVLDGSYHHLLATHGAVGCGILAVVLFGAFGGLARGALDRTETSERRSLCVASLQVLLVMCALYVTFEDMWWKDSVWPALLCFAVAMRSPAEYRASWRNRPLPGRPSKVGHAAIGASPG